jgi:hypothetical protein
MKRLVAALITVGLAAVSLPGCAETACSVVVVRAGSVRVVDGSQIRRLILGLDERSIDDADFGHQRFGDHGEKLVREGLARNEDKRIPERIEVRQRGAFKTCGEIAEFISTADRSASAPERRLREGMDCAAAHSIPEDAVLELLKATWNARLARREFALRCGRSEDCIPFLIWAGEKNALAGASPSFASRTAEASNANAKDKNKDKDIGKDKNKNLVRLIKPGQTAMLTWEQAGIRIVSPVTCLEAGGLGQFVRIRFKDAARTMRAEIVGVGMLRASL